MPAWVPVRVTLAMSMPPAAAVWARRVQWDTLTMVSACVWHNEAFGRDRGGLGDGCTSVTVPSSFVLWDDDSWVCGNHVYLFHKQEVTCGWCVDNI